MRDLGPITDLLRRVRRRLRAQRVVDGVSSMLILSGAWLLVAAFLLKVRHLGPEAEGWVLGGALTFPVAALLVGLLRPVRPMTAAQIADRRLGLKDRLGTAVDFTTREGELSAYAAAQVEEAREHARAADPRAAVPLRVPRRLWVFAGQLGALALLVLVPFFPEPREADAAAPPPTVDGMQVDFDELQGYNSFLNDVHQDALDEQLDEVAAAAEEFNRLLQDLADQQLPYRDALERIADLEQKLARERWEPEPEVEEYFAKVGRDLERSKLMNKAGEALRDMELREARDEVRQVAEQTKVEPPDPRRLEELRRAVEKAAKEQPPDLEKRRQELEQERRRLKQKQEGDRSEREKRRLKRTKQELERLERDLDRQRRQQEQLERLSRDLQSMAESLHLSADSDELQQLLDQLGEDINRMAREQSTEEQMQQLRERLDELRRMLQQLERGGKGFKLRLGRFNQGAGGKSGGSGGEKTLQLMPGGSGKSGGLALLRKQGAGAGGDKQGGEKQGGGQGDGIGTEHDPRTLGDPTKLKAQYTDVEVSPDQGEGPARSEVIETAADQGFSVRGYGKVHQTFESHEESLLEREEVPSGYRRYVRRYFERIRPR